MLTVVRPQSRPCSESLSFHNSLHQGRADGRRRMRLRATSSSSPNTLFGPEDVTVTLFDAKEKTYGLLQGSHISPSSLVQAYASINTVAVLLLPIKAAEIVRLSPMGGLPCAPQRAVVRTAGRRRGVRLSGSCSLRLWPRSRTGRFASDRYRLGPRVQA